MDVVDPTAEPLRLLLHGGTVTVTSPDGATEYELTATGNRNRPVEVKWRRNSGPWCSLNSGWSFAPGLLHNGISYFNPGTWRQPKNVELAGQSLLDAIFAGLQVWRLRCGTTILHPEYQPGAKLTAPGVEERLEQFLYMSWQPPIASVEFIDGTVVQARLADGRILPAHLDANGSIVIDIS